MIRAAALMLAALLTGCATSAAMTHYRVDLDLYVRDPALLCQHAWNIALPRWGLSVAESVTMTLGRFDSVKCLSVVVQTAEMGEQVVSAGVYVRDAAP